MITDHLLMERNSYSSPFILIRFSFEFTFTESNGREDLCGCVVAENQPERNRGWRGATAEYTVRAEKERM